MYRVIAEGGGQSRSGEETGHRGVIKDRCTFEEAFAEAKKHGQGTSVYISKLLTEF